MLSRVVGVTTLLAGFLVLSGTLVGMGIQVENAASPGSGEEPGAEEDAGSGVGAPWEIGEGSFVPLDQLLADAKDIQGSATEMDRNGEGDGSTCFAVFDPYLSCQKRWGISSVVGSHHEMVKTVSVPQAVPMHPELQDDPGLIYGLLEVVVSRGKYTPIPSFAPDQKMVEIRTDPPMDGLRIVRDADDAYYLTSDADSGQAMLEMWLVDDTRYHTLGIPEGLTFSSIGDPSGPLFPDPAYSVVQEWLQTRPWWGSDDLSLAVRDLADFFRSFGEGPIDPGEPDYFTALVESQNGCCRHRASGFVETMQALGLQARYVTNEGHAFAEVFFEDHGWSRIDLSGCGSYEFKNPNGFEPFQPTQDDNDALPQGEASPGGLEEEEASGEVADGNAFPSSSTTVRVTGLPTRLDKQDPLEGTVTVRWARGDVAEAEAEIFLNESKDQPGVLLGAATTESDGAAGFSFKIPKNLGASDYHVVAHHAGTWTAERYFLPSWSDPLIAITDQTQLSLEGPSVVQVDAAVEYTVRLVDESDDPIADSAIHWQLDGGSTETVWTDGRGVAAIQVPSGDMGTHELVASFSGSSHLGESTARVEFETRSLRFEPDEFPPWRVTPGEMLAVHGHLLDGGIPQVGETIRLSIFGQTEEIVTGEDGVVEVAFPVPINGSMGRQTLGMVAVDGGIPLGDFPVWVQVRPILLIPWSGHYVPGGTADVPFHVETESGGMEVRLTATHLASGEVAEAVTDSLGDGRIRLPLHEAGPGDIRFEILEAPDNAHVEHIVKAVPVAMTTEVTIRAGDPATMAINLGALASSGDLPEVASGTGPGLEQLNIQVQGQDLSIPWDSSHLSVDLAGLALEEGEAVEIVLRSDLPGHMEAQSVVVGPPPAVPLVFAIASAFAFLLAAGGVIWWLRRRTGQEEGNGIFDRRPALSIEVSRADWPEGMPWVATPKKGLTLRIEATTKDKEGQKIPVAAQAEVRVGDDETTHRLDSGGGEVEVPPLPVGETELLVVVRSPDHRPARFKQRVRCGTWRDLVQQEYERLVQLTRSLSPRLPEGFTPSMLAETLKGRTDLKDKQGVDRAVHAYVEAKYSRRTVSQDHWIAIAHAVRLGAPHAEVVDGGE